MSNFVIFAPYPASRRDCPNFFAEDIFSFSGPFSSTLSSIDEPIGEETFNTVLTLLCCGTIFSGLTLNFLSGGKMKGPDTKPSSIHVAIVSERILPYSTAESEF